MIDYTHNLLIHIPAVVKPRLKPEETLQYKFVLSYINQLIYTQQ